MKRRWILWLLVAAFLGVVATRFNEIQELCETLAQGQWEWVLAAALLQGVYYVAYAAVYQSAFYTVEVDSHISELVPVLLSSIFVNVVAPSGGASAAALFIDDAARRGQSAAKAAAGTLLVLMADFTAFTLVLGVGLAYLFLQHNLQAYEIVGTLAFIVMTAGLAGMLLLVVWRPEQLCRLLGWLRLRVNQVGGWFRRPTLLDDGWAGKNAAEFAQASVAITTYPRRLGRTLSIALGAHLVDLASLYTLFLAFHQPIKFGPLIAGFAVGILFLVVSPIPMGIGVVEGVMSLVYMSLGVPGEAATVITLAFRGLTFWLPFAIGFVLLRRVKAFGAEEYSRAEALSVRAASLFTGLMGLINVLSAVTRSLDGHMVELRHYLPLLVRRGGHLTAALAGFALLLLASHLWRRKRVAWLLTMVALVVSIGSNVLGGLDYAEFILAIGLVIWLWSLRPHFHARSDLPSVKQGLAALMAALLFTLAYGATGFFMLDRQFSVSFSLGAALRQTVTMFTEFYDPGLEPLTGFGRYFAVSIYVVGVVTLGYALWMLLRPVLRRRPASLAEHRRANAIVDVYGHSLLARFILFDDKSYYFSPGGSVVAYVTKGRVALALGDPVGPVSDVAAAIAGFQTYCAQNDWQPAFYQTMPDYLEHYQAVGFNALCIGHVEIVELSDETSIDLMRCCREKERFHPDWSPCYLVYPGPTSLPLVTLAMIRADSGDGFVWNYLTDLIGVGAARETVAG
jgi:uncharacterized protein (TIRG00374 family)